MGRMKELLEQRLEENKWELWWALRNMLAQWESWGLEGSPTDEALMEQARTVIAKIEEV